MSTVAVRRVSAAIVLSLVFGVLLPVTGAPAREGTSGWDLFRSWLIGEAHAAGGAIPEQQSGKAPGAQRQVAAGATRGHTGSGRALGRGAGELPAYSPQDASGVSTAAGRQAAPHIKGFDSAASKRLPLESSATTSVFENPDGSRTADVSQAVVNYRNTKGEWLPVDGTLVSGAGRLKPKAHGLDISLSDAAADKDLVTVGADASSAVTVGFPGSATKPTVEANQATYAGVQQGVDVIEEATPLGVKETLVLRDASAPTTYTFPLKLKGLRATVESDGSVSLTDAKGDVALTIPHGVMTDSHRLADGGLAQSDNVAYEIVGSGGQTALKMTIDSAWLKSPQRVFPVHVDPTINATTSGSGYYETNKVNGGPTELRIGTWDSGATHKARSYIAYSGFASQFAKQRVQSAQLKLFNIWAGSITASTTYTVSQVTSNWVWSTLASPGPSLGTAVGSWSGVAPAATQTTVNYTPTTGAWETTNFTAAGVGVLNGWINGSVNYGLGITTNETDNNAWKIFDSTAASANPPVLSVTYTPNIAPQVDTQYPPNNYAVQTLTPELLATGHDSDAFPQSITYSYTVKDSAGTVVATSGAVAKGDWVVPAGKLAWGKTYTWSVTTSDGSLMSLNPRWYALTTTVPQPLLTSELSQNTGARGFEPNAGNYTNEDKDIDVSTVGPSLSVERSYNSNDPRTSGAFGSGWSTIYDARATVKTGATGAETGVLVTYPDGREIGFGRNGDGTYSPAPGRYTRLASLGTNLGYTLTDKADTAYTFNHSLGNGAYGLGSVSDAEGRTETFTYDANNHITKATSASGRNLTFTWSTAAGGASAHVTSVSSDPVASGPETWTYAYNGDQLTGVCAPDSTTQCTHYSSMSSTLYPQAVLGLSPLSYYRLGEGAGATRAVDAVLPQAGADNGTYAGVSLGGAASLAGSTATTATFNGTSSSVALGNRLSLAGSYLSVALRFRADAADGVLFSYQQDPVTSATTSQYTPALYVGADGHLRGEFYNTSSAAAAMASPASVVDGKWHDVVLSGAGNTQSMYLDGVKVATLAAQIAPSTVLNTRYAYLGAGFVGGGWPDSVQTGKGAAVRWFKGAMSDASFYDRALTADEAAQLTARTAAVSALASITRPTGTTYATAAYDTASGRLASIVDEHGGAWTIKPQTVGGSSEVFASSVLGAAPQNYWRFGDASGPDANNEVNGDQMTFVDGVTVANAGRFKDSTVANFDGTSGYADFVNDPNTTGDAFVVDGGNQSVGLWFKTSTPTGVLAAYQVDDLASGAAPTAWVPMLYIGSDGKLRGEYWDGAANPLTSTGTVTDGKWHFVVLSATNAAQSLFLDGTQIAARSGTPKFNNANLNQHGQFGAGLLRNWPAGTGASTTPSFLKGSIGDTALYRTALTASQVAAQYAAATQSDGPAAVQTASMVDPGGRTISYDYDLGNGNRTLAETDALGNTTAYGYDVGGFLYTETDPNGNVTTSGHDVRGNVVSTKTCQDFSTTKCSTVYYTYYPDDTTAAPAPDPRNDLILTMRDGRSASATDNTYLTSYAYDTAGNQTQVTTPPVPGFTSGRSTATTYTTSTTPAVGGGTTPAGLPATVTTPGGKVTTLSYAANGDLTTQKDPSGLTTSFAYDSLGRVTSKTQVSDSYPNGLTTSYQYDGNDQVVKETDPGSTNVVTGVVHTPVTSTAFDPNGNVTSQSVSDATGGDATRTTSATFDTHDRLLKSTDASGASTSYGYDAYGNRTSETDENGNVTGYSFDAEGRLLTVTAKGYTGDPANPTTAQDVILSSRAYDPAGRLASLTDAMGRVTTYTYTDDGLLAAVARSSGTSTFTVRDVLHDAAGNVIQDTTNNGATVTTTVVDAAGRPTSTTFDPSGLNRTTSYEYDGDDNVTKMTLTDGKTGSRTTTSTYDANGGVLQESVTGSVDSTRTATTTYARDQRGAVLSMTDPLGQRTDYVNDESGQVVSVVSPQVSVEQNGVTASQTRPTSYTGYDTFGDQTNVKDANGNVSTSTFDPAGRVLTESAPAYTPPGSTTSITPVTRTAYDASGQVVSTTDPSGNVTKYAYDQLGDLTQQTDPDGGVVSSTYDLGGEQLSTTDALGAVTSATYDFMGRRVTQTDQVRQPTVRNLTTTYSYGSNGWPASTTSPAGVVQRQTVDAAGEPTSTTDGAGNSTSFAYDYAGRKVKTTFADATASTAAFDDLGDQVSQSDLDSAGNVLRTNSASYDLAGRVLFTTDPRGGGATYTYDSNGQIATEAQKVDSATTIATSFGYDAAGNRTRFTDGRGNAFTTTYNAWNLPESQIEPATTAYPNAADRTFTAAYDASGRIASSTSPGNVVVSNSYDAMGRLTGSTGSGAEAATTARAFAWDKAGHLTSASAPGGSDTFSYDDRGALLTADGPQGTSRFTYAADGQVESRTDAAGVTSYGYDSAGRLASVADPATGQTATYGYRSMNLVSSITYGGGNKRSFGYDALHRMTSDAMTTSTGAAVGSIAYGYDLSDNLTSKTTAGFSGPATNTYTYDLANRLSSWNNGTTTTAYGYDASGNRTKAGAVTYTYDARNQLLGDGSKTYQYTARGTLAAVSAATGTTTSTFDAFNQAATQGGSSFTYDALGRLGSSTGSSGATTFSYSGASDTLASDGGSTYTWDNNGGLLAVGKGSTTTAPVFAWTDQHDDVVGQFGSASTGLTSSVAYDPWGNLVTGRTLAGGLGFQSGWTDSQSGRVDMLSRWYDPTNGQFISRDRTNLSPAPNSVSANRFAYVNDNPMGGTDPTGQCSFFDVVCGVQAAYHAAASAVSSAWNSVSSSAGRAFDDGRTAITHVYHAAARVVHAVVATAKHYYHQAVHHVQDAYHAVKHYVSRAYHAVRQVAARVYHSVKHYAKAAYHVISTAVHRGVQVAHRVVAHVKQAVSRAASSLVHRALQARQWVRSAFTSSVHFLKKHAATIASIAVSTVVFIGCEAVVTGGSAGTLSAPGAIACGALAGAAGNIAGAAVSAAQSGHSLSLGEAESAGLSGAVSGALGGAAGAVLGKAVSLVGSKLSGPVSRMLGRGVAEGDGAAEDAAGAVCRVGHSFTAATAVVLASGALVAIAGLHVGDLVKTVDARTGAVRAQPVVRVMKNHDVDLVDVTVRRGRVASTVHTTANHPFWSATRGAWVRADQLGTTDRLRSSGGPAAEVAVARVAAVAGAQDRWDLTIAHDHDYFVRTAAGDALVHNCGEGAANASSDAADGAAETAAPETTTLFRAVGQREADDIAASGGYRNAPGLEGKYFFRTSQQAEQYGQMMNKAPGFGAPNYLTSGSVPTSALSSAEGMEAGSEGPGLFFRGDLNKIFNVTNHGLIP